MACILHAIENKLTPQYVLFLDPIKLIQIRFNSKLRKIVNKANFVLAESSGFIWASKKRKTPLRERVPLIATIMDIIRLAQRADLTIYFLGSQRDYLDKVFFNMQKKFSKCTDNRKATMLYQ